MLFNTFNKTNINSKTVIYWINIIIFLFIFRTALPVFKYPFILLYSTFVIFLIYNYSKYKPQIRDYLKNYILVLALFIVLIFSTILLSSKIYLLLIKDLSNLLIVLSFFFILTSLVKNKNEAILFRNILINLTIIFAIGISLIKINDFLNEHIFETKIDYNFSTIIIFFGFISAIFKINCFRSQFKIIIFNFILIILFIAIILLASRRAIFLALLLFLILFISWLINIFKQNYLLANFSKKIYPFLIAIILIITIVYLTIFNTSYIFKNRILTIISPTNLTQSKDIITYKTARILNIAIRSNSYRELYEAIWGSTYDPNDPDSKWGTRFHKTVYPLTGENIEIVPNKAKGYLLDNKTNASQGDGRAYSFTLIGNDFVKKGDVLESSVYCYVTQDFNGAWVGLSSKGKALGYKLKMYDLTKKGIWQKLELRLKCNKGNAPMYLSLVKNEVNNFSTLKGHVIFAYPQYKVIKKDSLTIRQDTLIIKEQSKVKNKKSNGIQQFYQTSNNEKFDYQKAGIFDFTCLNIKLLYQSEDKDPIRNWIANLVAEDTTYNPYYADLKVDSISDNFIAPRTARWQFAWQIFTKEYNWVEKIFGGGFDFLNWYGYYFLKDKTKSDWPHNPFLSVLLYSGIVGLLLYLFFLYKVFYLYIKYIKEYYLLFIFFLICFYFSFFSAGHPFDPPVTGFFAMLPFLIHSVHKKEKENSDKQTDL